MPRKTKPKPRPVNAATQWARDAVAGEFPAGELMLLAAKRHLSDIDRTDIFFDEEAAQEAIDFFPKTFSVTAGAMAGAPFELPNYLSFVVGSLFGWKMAETKRLRFREAWIEVGKGMVKTPLSAAIGLYIMGGRGIRRSEVYAIAKDRNQASVLFNDAVALCRSPIPTAANESLESAGDVVLRGTGEMTWMIEHPETSSKFRVLSNDEKISGPRPAMVAADEIHEWSSAGQIELWKAALTKMSGDSLLMLTTNTPAADQIMATEMSEYYQSILRGIFTDDAAFALIARVDTDDDPMTDESCWKKALPLLGITFPVENVRVAVNSSKHRMATALATKRLYFGVPVGASNWWIDLDAWSSVQGKVDPREFRDERCVLALDLSQKNDLTALTAVWDDGVKKKAKVWYWRPAHGVQDASRADGAQYVEWAEGGFLNLVPGRTIEYEYVAVKVQELMVNHGVTTMAFDPAHIGEFRKACDRIGFKTWIWEEGAPPGEGLKMVIHSQGRAGMHSKKTLWMPRSLQQLEDLILKGDVIIDESPLTNWCSSNAAVEADAQNNRWLVRKRIRGRIDGVVSLAMGIGIASSALESAPEPTFQMFAVG